MPLRLQSLIFVPATSKRIERPAAFDFGLESAAACHDADSRDATTNCPAVDVGDWRLEAPCGIQPWPCRAAAAAGRCVLRCMKRNRRDDQQFHDSSNDQREPPAGKARQSRPDLQPAETAPAASAPAAAMRPIAQYADFKALDLENLAVAKHPRINLERRGAASNAFEHQCAVGSAKAEVVLHRDTRSSSHGPCWRSSQGRIQDLAVMMLIVGGAT